MRVVPPRVASLFFGGLVFLAVFLAVFPDAFLDAVFFLDTVVRGAARREAFGR